MVLTVTLHITWEANHARIANYNLPSTSPVWYSLCHSAVNSLTIVDSERLEYMHHSESCVCVVQIINRKQHQCYPIAQHAIVRVKEPPHIRYTGSLTIKQYHKLERQFTNLFPSPNHEQIQQLSKQILAISNVSIDIKVFGKLYLRVFLRTINMLKIC